MSELESTLVRNETGHIIEVKPAAITWTMGNKEMIVHTCPLHCWISIKDRLPANSHFVIVTEYSYEKKKSFCSIGYFHEKWFNIHDEEISCEYEVTFWMPLPEPKEEEK